MSFQKQLKDVDSVRQAIWLGNFMRVFPLLAIPGLLFGRFQGFLIAAAASVVAAVCSEVFSDMIGSGSVKTLFGVGRRTSTLRERLAGDLSQVGVYKMRTLHVFRQKLDGKSSLARSIGTCNNIYISVIHITTNVDSL